MSVSSLGVVCFSFFSSVFCVRFRNFDVTAITQSGMTIVDLSTLEHTSQSTNNTAIDEKWLNLNCCERFFFTIPFVAVWLSGPPYTIYFDFIAVLYFLLDMWECACVITSYYTLLGILNVYGIFLSVLDAAFGSGTCVFILCVIVLIAAKMS